MGRFFRSMYFRLLLIMIAVSLVPLCFLEAFFTNFVKEHMRSNRIDLVSQYAVMLGNEMIRTDFLSGTPSDVIAGEVEQFSGLYNGRIIVVDSSLNVLKDTYGMIEGKQLVSEEAVNSVNGTDSSGYDTETDEVLITHAVKNASSEEILGSIIFYVSCYDLTDTYDNINHTLTIVVICVGVLMIALSFLLARTFTRPFKGVAKSINRISDGFFDEEVHLRGYYEIEQISDAFNAMLKKLEMLESSRQEFVSNVSHELKTPITSIKVLADSLNGQQDAPVELYREFMQDIVEEIDRENIIINDLLALVKMDKTAAELNISTLMINDLLELILKRLRPIAAKRNIELVLESYRSVEADCDEVKLTLAISNLVENAIKYNNAGGWVRVSLDSDHKYFYISVADSGIGIPPEQQQKIFERFYRVDKARSRETGGTGLGLAITKNIIQMHKGNIKVSSTEDEGTTFSLRIPLTYSK